MSSLKEETCYVLTVEHFSGTITEVLGVFLDLEAAKEVQRSYDTLTRISVTVYRTSLFSQEKPRRSKNGTKASTKAKNTRTPKATSDGETPEKKCLPGDISCSWEPPTKRG